MTLFWCALAWLAGMGLALRWPLPPLGLVALATAGAALAGARWREGGGRTLGLAAVALGFGALRWLGDAPPPPGPGDLAAYHGQRVTVRGWISGEPMLLPGHTRLPVTVESIALPAPSGRASAAGGTPTHAPPGRDSGAGDAGTAHAATPPAPGTPAAAPGGVTEPSSALEIGAGLAAMGPAAEAALPVEPLAGSARLPAEPPASGAVAAGQQPVPGGVLVGERPVAGGLLAIVPGASGWRYGERLALTGELNAPPVFDGFAYRDYLARQGVTTMLRYPRVERLSGSVAEPWWAALYDLKARLRAGIVRQVPEPEAGLLAGVLLGDRAAMPGWLSDAFAATNTTHLLAISGWNITLVGGWAGALAGLVVGRRRLPRLLIVAAALLAYTALVGASPSVVRAAVMGLLALLAGWAGRPADTLPALGFAALAMTAREPGLLLDTGFQLSCLATLGIVLGAGPIAAWLATPLTLQLPPRLDRPAFGAPAAEAGGAPAAVGVPPPSSRSTIGARRPRGLFSLFGEPTGAAGVPAIAGGTAGSAGGPATPAVAHGRELALGLPWWLARMLSVTLAAELFTTPLLAFDFHRLSLVGLAANLALDPLMEPVMILGALAALAALAPWDAVAVPLAWLAWLPANLMVQGVAWFAGLPLAALDIGEVDARLLTGWYALLAGWLLLREPAVRAALAGLRARLAPAPAGLLLWSGLWTLALAGALILTPAAPAPDRLLFLRLGSGDALLVRGGAGAVALLDGGSNATEAAGALGRRLPFWARRLDLLALTGARLDRIAGLPEVARRYDLALVLLPPDGLAAPPGRGLREALAERPTPALPAAPGQAVPLGADGQMRVLAARRLVSNPATPATGSSRGQPARPSSRSTAAGDPATTALRIDLPHLSAVYLTDLALDVQRDLLASGEPLRADVLRLPARGALTPELLGAVAPRLVILPAPGPMDAAAPLDALPDDVRASLEIWTTGPDGTIEVANEGSGPVVRRLR